jgi:hypothetical protein
MSSEITVEVNGQSVEVKMTFGLLNEMCRLCGDLDGMAMLMLDNDLRVQALKTLLSKRDEKGKVVEEINIETLDISTDHVLFLLDWAAGHVSDFFIRAATTTRDRVEPLREKVRVLSTS